MAATTKVRWGILGTAQIAQSAFIPALRQTENGEVAAIGSRSGDKARAFAKEHGIPQAYDSYEGVLDDPNVDAVYIPLPNTLHAEWIIRAAQAGKHIFCEKPLTMTYAEAKKAVQACKDAGVMLVEAFVYRFHRQNRRLRELLDAGEIGEVLHTDARFHYSYGGPPDNIRVRPELGGGALLDVGCYVLSWARFVMGELPLAVAATSVPDDSGVDKTTVATLRFARGRTANVSSGIRMYGGQQATIYGTHGQIDLTHPFHPAPVRDGVTSAKVLVHKFGKTMDVSVPTDKLSFHDALDQVNRSILTGEPLPFSTMDDALDQALLMEACRLSVEDDRWVDLASIDCRAVS